MRRRTVWITTGLAAVAVLVAAVIWIVVPRGESAEDRALAYFHALAGGDLEAVRATGVEVSAEAASVFLDASEHLSDVTVGDTTQTATSTIITVTYELSGERVETNLAMIEVGGVWTPDAESAQGEASFNVPVSIGESALVADSPVALLPATYEAVAIPAKLLDARAIIQVLPGRTQDAVLEPQLRPKATDIAQAQLDEHLTACTASSTDSGAEPRASCGITIPSAADFSAVSGISYQIVQLPSLVLTPTTFYAGDGELVAVVTGTALDGSPKSLTYRTENWTLRGDVSFTVDDIVLSVW